MTRAFGKIHIPMLAAMLLVDTAFGHAEERPTVAGGAYDKPHIQRSGTGTILGGYIDHELLWNEKRKTFDQHRFIPFIYGQVSERIHVMAEIEFEHGGLVKGSGGTDGEIKLEFATLDIGFSESFNYRGGVVLSPLGRFNLIHDSPLNDLTNRPLVSQQITPTTLSESGMGFFGTIYPSEDGLLGYEVYLVNGFNQQTAESIRSGRGSHKADNNEQKSIVGRLNYSPSLGVGLGASMHTGAYDDAGDETLTIVAVDADYNRGPYDLKAEYATANVGGVDVNSRSGYYGQVGYHLFPGILSQFPNSICTATFRYDFIDLDGGTEETRYTFGVNFRPQEETVLKLDYEVYDQDEDSTGILFSVASYF